MKSVLLSIQPRWCGLIAAGKKTLEIRKSRPNLKTPFRCYIYCTKGKPFLNNKNGQVYISKDDVFGNLGYGLYHRLNGRIIGEFVCSDIDRLGCVGSLDGAKKVTWIGIYDRMNSCWRNFDPSLSCLNDEQVKRYLSGNDGFAWNISNLKIYDAPKCLGEFTRLRETKFGFEPVRMERPPQSWCYVENGG